MIGSCEIVTGTLGGAKTSLAMEKVLAHLIIGGWCYVNIEVYHDLIRQRLAEDGYVFEAERLVFLTCPMSEVHKHVKRGTLECPVMLVWDEAHIEGNALDHKQADRDMLNFVTFVRKLDITLIFITQSSENVLKQIRRLVQKMTVCRNMKQMKILGVIPCPLPLYFRTFYDCTAPNRPPAYQGFQTFLVSPAWGLFNSDAILGKEKEKYLAMKTAVASPLKRCKPAKKKKRPGISLRDEMLAMAACVGMTLWLA